MACTPTRLSRALLLTSRALSRTAQTPSASSSLCSSIFPRASPLSLASSSSPATTATSFTLRTFCSSSSTLLSSSSSTLLSSSTTTTTASSSSSPDEDSVRLRNGTVVDLKNMKGAGRNVSVGTSLFNLGTEYAEKNDFDTALELFTKAAEYFAREQGEAHPKLAETYFAMGLLHAFKKDLEVASRVIDNGAELLRKANQRIMPHHLIGYNYICAEYNNRGDLENAHVAIKKALGLVDGLVDGKTDPVVMTVLRNAGEISFMVGKYPEALQFFEDLLSAQIVTVGGEHEDTSATYNAIGDCHYSMGDAQQALDLYEKALEIRTARLGADSMDTAITLGNVGSAYIALGEHGSGREYLRKSLEVQTAVLGAESPALSGILSRIADSHVSENEHKEALPYLERILAVEKVRVGGEDDLSLANLYQFLSVTYAKTNDADKSLDAADKSLALRKKHIGEESTETAWSYSCVANAHYMKGDFAKALELHKVAASILLQTEGEDYPPLVNQYVNISNAYFKLGDRSKAEEFYKKGTELRAKLGTSE